MPPLLLAAALLAQPPGTGSPWTAESSVRESSPRAGRPTPPTDRSAEAMVAFETALTNSFGGTREIPLAEKAAFYEWVTGRHHLERFPRTDRGAPVGLVHHAAWLPDANGRDERYQTGSDTVTWNGALLAAMSYRWAATRDPVALEWVRTLLGGLELATTVTGQVGLPARCYTQSDQPVNDLRRRYDPPGGPPIHFRSDAAKGTLNQVAAGLIVCQLLCGDALGEEDRGRAATLSLEIADHLVRHDYHLTEANGQRTEYGNVMPRIGPQSIPFNAQVAYVTVAGGAGLGVAAPDADPGMVARVAAAFEELRGKHHVYYESPGTLIRPQRVGANPLVKGMNDRQHVFMAGYAALLLEWELARKANAAADGRFLYEMGRTPLYAIRGVRGERNSLLSFLWGGLLMDGRRAVAILPDARERDTEYAAARTEIDVGVEHLRRFPLSRREVIHEEAGKRSDVWPAEENPWDCYVWKADPNRFYRATGPYMNKWAAGIDYLHAYWAARYWGVPGVR